MLSHHWSLHTLYDNELFPFSSTELNKSRNEAYLPDVLWVILCDNVEVQFAGLQLLYPLDHTLAHFRRGQLARPKSNKSVDENRLLYK